MIKLAGTQPFGLRSLHLLRRLVHGRLGALLAGKKTHGHFERLKTSNSNWFEHSFSAFAMDINLKTVLIIGGSFGGLSALNELKGKPGIRIILVDQRSYFEYIPGILRLFCDPELHESVARPMPQLAAPHKFIQAKAVEINKDSVGVQKAGGGPVSRIFFDYLIVATGANYGSSITPDDSENDVVARKSSWVAQSKKIRKAQSVLVLGGGAVGTELAAEVICHYPGKKITIVDAQDHLVPLFPKSSIAHTEDWFHNRGAELVLGEMLGVIDKTGCTTKGGRRIEADVVFVCFGMKCNTRAMAQGDMAASLDKRGAIQVNDYLQIVGDNPNCFAVGDAMVHPAKEIKQAYYAELNGKLAAENVLRMVAKVETLLKYPDAAVGASVSPLVYVISLGRYDGSLGFNKLVLNGKVAAGVKWILEKTKIMQMEGNFVGKAVWAFGDYVSFVLSRTLLAPVRSKM